MGIYQCEHEAQPEVFQSMFDSLWWAVATLTTVGYGDVYPVTPGGRLFTFPILLVGLAWAASTGRNSCGPPIKPRGITAAVLLSTR